MKRIRQFRERNSQFLTVPLKGNHSSYVAVKQFFSIKHSMREIKMLIQVQMQRSFLPSVQIFSVQNILILCKSSRPFPENLIQQSAWNTLWNMLPVEAFTTVFFSSFKWNAFQLSIVTNITMSFNVTGGLSRLFWAYNIFTGMALCTMILSHLSKRSC